MTASEYFNLSNHSKEELKDNIVLEVTHTLDFLRKPSHTPTKNDIEYLSNYVGLIEDKQREAPEALTEAEEKLLTTMYNNGITPELYDNDLAKYRNRIYFEEVTLTLTEEEKSALSDAELKQFNEDNPMLILKDREQDTFRRSFADYVQSINADQGQRVEDIINNMYDAQIVSDLVHKDITGTFNTMALIRYILSSFPVREVSNSELMSRPNTYIANKKYSFALTAYKNPYAYLTMATPEDQIEGQLSIFGNPYEELLKRENSEKTQALAQQQRELAAQAIDAALAHEIFELIRFCNEDESNTGLIKINLETLKKVVGAKYKKEMGEKIESALNDMHRLVGIINGNAAYRFLQVVGGDADGYIYLRSEYDTQIVEAIKKDPAHFKTNKQNEVVSKIEGYNFLPLPTIRTAKNKNTADACIYLLNRMLQHGRKQEPKLFITYADIMKGTIVDNITTLYNRFYETEEKYKTQFLERVFIGNKCKKLKPGQIVSKENSIEEYIRKFSRAFDYFEGLNIEVQQPHKDKLYSGITLSWTGINEDFKRSISESE